MLHGLIQLSGICDYFVLSFVSLISSNYVMINMWFSTTMHNTFITLHSYMQQFLAAVCVSIIVQSLFLGLYLCVSRTMKEILLSN